MSDVGEPLKGIIIGSGSLYMFSQAPGSLTMVERYSLACPGQFLHELGAFRIILLFDSFVVIESLVDCREAGEELETFDIESWGIRLLPRTKVFDGDFFRFVLVVLLVVPWITRSKDI